MCRIAGFWDLSSPMYDMEQVCLRMRDSMTYGGPDDAGIYVERENGLALGHRRLSILDLSPLGHQPMSDDRGEIWVTFNGEVYNFHEIRNELIAKGYTFRSMSDTEVILNAYREWGLDSVQRFRGMFAYALWDKRRQELILCRDRVGVKPLYWYQDRGVFLFSSELKGFFHHPSFHAEIDHRAVSTFLTFGYITAPHSIFKNAQKVKPGHYLVIGRDGVPRSIPYWDSRSVYERGMRDRENGRWDKRSEDDIAAELEHLLRECFRYRMVSDVPVGVFLSGGIDSSTLAALLTQEGFHLKTFTIGFREQAYSEAEHAKAVAAHLGTDHTELYCTPREAFDIIPKLPAMYDEPFGDDSGIPTHLVSLLARSRVTVSLSADGGDELFCGYGHYRTMEERLHHQRSRPWLRLAGDALGLLSPDIAYGLSRLSRPFFPEKSDFRYRYRKIRQRYAARTIAELDLITRRYFLDDELDEHLLPRPYEMDNTLPAAGDMDWLMYRDFNYYLPDDILVKVDRASMAVALESREPFLDHLLVEFAASLPLSYKYGDGISKRLLKKILYKYVPRELVERPKQGFGVPIEEWFKNDLKSMILEYLGEDRLRGQGLFDAARVVSLRDKYLADEGVGVQRLWLLLMFEMWYDRWMSH